MACGVNLPQQQICVHRTNAETPEPSPLEQDDSPPQNDSWTPPHSPEQTRTSLSLELAHNWHPVPRTTPRCCSEESSHFPFLEDVAEKRLLCRARLSPNRLPALPVKPQQGQRAEGSEPRARQLPVIQRSCLKEKEEKGKLPPLVAPREVDFIARAIETREKNKREKKKKKKKKEKLPQYIQKYLNEEKKKKTELAVEEKSKEQSTGVIEAKAKAEKEAPNGRGKEESQKEMQRSQESSSSECSSDSSTSSVESDASSCDLLEIRTIMENWEEAEEEPPTVPEDNTVPPKRSLSPRTDRALREVVTCILGQVARKRRGERDEQLDLQDKLQCELAVLRWERSGKEAGSSQHLREAAPQAAPPAKAGERRAGPVQSHECTEEGRRKLWDSVRSKIEQKRSSGTAKGLEKRARAMGGPVSGEQIYSTSASVRRPSQALRLPRETSSKSLLQRDERQCRPARLLTPALPSVQ
ncbi:uncharacterized protein LOC135575927 [Columba livia]|uniref:uncharacterized protein LOC135575927 n=1 Tax=Columba livia TaxID=8932 RepID=UPI0031BBA4B4